MERILITGAKNFKSVADLLGNITGRSIEYQSPNLLRFFLEKRKEGLPAGYIFVMIMLHYLPRFQKVPEISRDFSKLTGDEPGTLAAFIERNKQSWLA